MATIKDVARMAGVSISTASYAVNGTGCVKQETKERILAAVRELGYCPDGNARALRENKKNIIGLILSDLFGPFYSEIIQGVQEVCLEKGYDMMVISSAGGENSTAVRFLKERRTDGMIVLANIDLELIKNAAQKDMPIVMLNRRINAPYVLNIAIDNYGGAYRATEYLLGMGYADIAYLSGPQGSINNEMRFLGYKDALSTHEVPFDPERVVYGGFNKAGGYQAAKEMLRSGRMPPAIFAANDEMAIGVIEALRGTEYRVGENIALIGFDDIELARYITPALTTVHQSKYEMGLLAAQLLFDAILQGKISDEPISLPTELILRDTCPPFPQIGE